MINFNINNTFVRIVFSLIVAFNLISCEEEEPTTYDNKHSFNKNIGLTYQNIATYAFEETIATADPSYTIENSVYNFEILEIILSDGSELTSGVSNFSINEQSGGITINNNSGFLVPGETYSFNIGVGNVDGVIRTDNAFQLSLFETPLDYTITNDTYDANYLENVEVATITYVDTSENGDVLENVVYNLVNAPNGFSIESGTGIISKSTAAASGTHQLSVEINTNVGAKVFDNVLTVNVGEAPTLSYVQADGVTALSKVVLSPWTAYSTSVPNLEGMNAVSFEAILPAELPVGSVVANADGSLSIAADQNLPLGNYIISVEATNASDVSAIFENQLEIQVEVRWETTDFFNDTFDDDTTGSVDPGNSLYPDFAGYSLGLASFWNKAVVSKSGLPTIRGLRVQNPGTNHHYMVKTVDITGVKGMRISFGEQWGYNDNFATVSYQRAVYAGESTTDLESGSFNAANWTEVMGKADSRWPASSTWKTRMANPIDNVDVDLSNISGTTLKLAWYIGGETAQNGQYLLDYCKAQVSMAFAAEEE